MRIAIQNLSLSCIVIGIVSPSYCIVTPLRAIKVYRCLYEVMTFPLLERVSIVPFCHSVITLPDHIYRSYLVTETFIIARRGAGGGGGGCTKETLSGDTPKTCHFHLYRSMHVYAWGCSNDGIYPALHQTQTITVTRDS